jgi:exopolysaccharide/PEP-CTERM locus tyrosine autokinase
MSFIERALEQLKPVPESAPTQPTSTEHAKPVIQKARPAAPADTGSAVPCRADRILSIDVPRLRSAGVIGPEDEERRIAEEYRLIKRPLLKAIMQADAGKLGNVVVVTSAVPGEGKTFTSINLALSLALERDIQVVLVDGDVAKRDITHVFGLDEEPGLLDASGDTSVGLEQAILRTDVASLYIMPAGNQQLEATEILASERTASLLAELAAPPRRIVLIDSPPLLATTEAGVLVSLAGQVVMVVKASETPQNVVTSAIETIAEDKPVSLVLNQVLSVPERHYGYYYGGYGYGREQGKTSTGTSAKDDSQG